MRWFWCGVLGELYGGAIETRFARDIEMVPAWAQRRVRAATPRTVQDANFAESRLHSLRTRNAAAYKGIARCILAKGARDWMEDKALDKVQYVDLAVDIHHVFPQKWCDDNGIDDEHRESIVNKTTHQRTHEPHDRRRGTIVVPGGHRDRVRRSRPATGRAARDPPHRLPSVCAPTTSTRFFIARRESLCQLVETAIGKAGPARHRPGLRRGGLRTVRARRSGHAEMNLTRRTEMALSNRDRIGRMFEMMAPALDDFIASVIGQGDPPSEPRGRSSSQAKDGKKGHPPTRLQPARPAGAVPDPHRGNITSRFKPGWYPVRQDARQGRANPSPSSSARSATTGPTTEPSVTTTPTAPSTPASDCSS